MYFDIAYVSFYSNEKLRQSTPRHLCVSSHLLEVILTFEICNFFPPTVFDTFDTKIVQPVRVELTALPHLSGSVSKASAVSACFARRRSKRATKLRDLPDTRQGSIVVG